MKTNNLVKAYKNTNVLVTGGHNIRISKGSFVEDISTLESVCGFIVPISGKALYKINKTSYQLDEKFILHAGPGMSLSKYVGDTEWHYLIIHYKVSGPREDKELIENNVERIMLSSLQQARIKDITYDLISLYNQSSSTHDICLKIKLLEVIDLFLKASKQDNITSESEKIDFSKTYIRTHLDSLITVNDLSDLIGIPLKRYTYLFTKLNGESPKKYINKMKIKVAKELLINTDKCMVDIAFAIGYDDVFYFSRFFKKNTGFSPSEFRLNLGKSPC